jgi:hypothetical protein
MSKPLLGLIFGAILGCLDGLTALFTPEAAPMITGILIGSTFKGVIAGIIIGFVAKKYNSLPLGLVIGFGVGLVLAFLVAAMPDESGKHYWIEIMIPGSLVGLILGYITQKYGRAQTRTA